MTIFTALKKVNTLSQCELRHCVQRMDEQIKQYERASLNDPPARKQRYGVPYMKALRERRQRFIDKLTT